jgi:hypothetical protein
VSARLEAGTTVAAELERVWEVLVDWHGQARWIPLTTLQVHSPHARGLGVRIAALSGFWLGRVPLGLLDNFVVTGWSPPVDGEAELEVLHLGPFFTGEGVFHLSAADGHTVVRCVELVTVPGGPAVNRLVALALPVMRRGFLVSLARLAAVCEGRRA